jgi:hypothetical protein
MTISYIVLNINKKRMEKMSIPPVVKGAPEEPKSADAIAMDSFNEMGRMAIKEMKDPVAQEATRKAADAMYELDKAEIAAKKAKGESGRSQDEIIASSIYSAADVAKEGPANEEADRKFANNM